MNFKKILIYIEPWIEDAKTGWRQNYIWWFGNIVNTLQANYSNQADVIFIIGDDCAPYWEKHKNTNATAAVITQPELKKIFFNSRTALTSWLQGTYSSDQIQNMALLVASKLKDFEPDLVFTITPSPFLNHQYPGAMVLYRDALYCREPWPDEMTCFDPLGIYIHGAINKLSSELLMLPNTEQSDKFYNAIKEIFLDVDVADNPFAAIISELRSVHRHIILMPLQSSSHYNFYSATHFANQFEYLCQVLDDVPRNIGVVVTQHPDDLTLNASTIDFLRATYSNFIYIDIAQNYHAPSQLILSLVDGLISVSSGLCYQAMLWGKPIFVMGKSHFLPYSESCQLKDMKLVLERHPSVRTGVIHWLLTHYFFSYSYLKNEDWLSNYLATLRENIKRYGISLSTFPPIDSAAEILVNLEIGRREPLKLKDNASTSASLEKFNKLEEKTKEYSTQIASQEEAINHRNKIIQEKDDFINELHNQNIELEQAAKEYFVQLVKQEEAINHRNKIIQEKDILIKELHNRKTTFGHVIKNLYRKIIQFVC